MSEKVIVGMRGQIVIPKKLRKKYNIEDGMILEIFETNEGLLLKLFNSVSQAKGIGEGVFGDPLKYQRRLRKNWECKQRR